MTKKTKGKVGIDSFISWGATIVIIGLMFKLQHWPYGDWMIVIGLGTEAILFILLGFQAMWNNTAPEETVQQAGSNGLLDSLFKDANISPETIENLGAGLRNFGEKVASISQIADASIANNAFTDQLTNATSELTKLNAAYGKAAVQLAAVEAPQIDSGAYNEQIQRLSSNLEALNKVYETEFLASGSSIKTMNQHYESIARTLDSISEAGADANQFKEQVKHLNNSLIALNTVYGNMLTAMSQPRSN